MIHSALLALVSPLLAYYPDYGSHYYQGGGYGFGLGVGAGYWILFLGTLALSFGAMLAVRGAYARYSKVPASSGMTGAEVAARILDLNGIRDVAIREVPGKLTDHYDPQSKTLNLSEENYHGRSVAALGVSAHECGHALQHQQGYEPLQWRMAAVGITQFASTLLFWVPLLGIFLHIFKVSLIICALAMGVIMLFQLITLPVEFNATARAKRIIPQIGAVAPGAEMAGMNRVLNAAALTYVAAFISSLAYFLYYLLRLQGGSRN